MLFAVIGNLIAMLLIGVSVFVFEDERKQLIAQIILTSIQIAICIGVSFYYRLYHVPIGMALLALFFAYVFVTRPKKPR